MFSSSRRRAVTDRIFVASALCAATALLSSCMANPGDAPTVPGQQEAPVQQEDPTAEAAKMREVTVGVDEFVEGFNPHLLADVSPVTSLVARLTLPSVFNRAPEPALADSHSDADVGTENAENAAANDTAGQQQWLVNEELLDSVQVLQDAQEERSPDGIEGDSEAKLAQVDVTNPNVVASHVRYRIRPGAQWSDGTPISGEDFRYLYSQVTSTPGALDAATYGLIKTIKVSDGGRQVDVTFKEPVAHWQRLFANLLPAHLMRTNTDGFSQGLSSRFPASGGQYTVESMDVGRNIIRLVRNDRYWGQDPAASEVITLRAMRTAVDGAEQLRSKQIQAIQVRPHETSELTYGLVPDVSEFFHEPNRELIFSTNLASKRLQDSAVRSEVLSTINVRQIAEVATGRRVGGDEPETGQPKPAAVEKGIFTEDDPLLIGIVSDGRIARAAAFAVSDQLSAAGIPAKVISYSPRDLLRSSLPYGTVDAVVAWEEQPTSVPAARERYACTSGLVGSMPPEGSEGMDKSEASSSSSEDTESIKPDSTETGTKKPDTAKPNGTKSEVSDTEDDAAVPVAPKSAARTENLSGLCDRRLDELLSPDRTDVPAEIDEIIAGHAIETTLVEDSLLTVISPEITITGRENPAQWDIDPMLGRLGMLGEVRRVGAQETASDKSDTAEPQERADNNDADNNDADSKDADQENENKEK
ncbi:MAG: ABC transporter family substrate-binding protein [Corynebacterium sp.]|uniref:ABC transporter family substrate-binding protein n=1 Tax=Corynebacterium sp. TaxID=1720 RepID=UPI0026DBD308|nr:ABC transporter family substrate-binding protein [Corynebacterium sp.]MDO5029476.1 ABC transporter family substrate-binding protein [Corynebacterium sp.]